MRESEPKFFLTPRLLLETCEEAAGRSDCRSYLQPTWQGHPGRLCSHSLVTRDRCSHPAVQVTSFSTICLPSSELAKLGEQFRRALRAYSRAVNRLNDFAQDRTKDDYSPID